MLPPSSIIRRVVAGVLVMTAVVGIGVPTAHAHEGHEGDDHGSPAVIDVVEVHGFLDPVLVDMLADVLSSVDPAETVAVVLQVDSTASVVDDAELARLADLIVAAPVPVSFWVGPSGARATRTKRLSGYSSQNASNQSSSSGRPPPASSTRRRNSAYRSIDSCEYSESPQRDMDDGSGGGCGTVR